MICRMFKSLLCLCLVGFAAAAVCGQTALQKLVDSEHAFAEMAAKEGTPAAFLAYMTDDASVFNPDIANAKKAWTGRKNNGSLLSWAPNYADISSNGLMGYTTGNWEFRPKGKDDTPSAFGEFITIWMRQPAGTYKWVVDIGIAHAKPDKYSTDWVTAKDRSSDPNKNGSSAADTANGFIEIADRQDLKKAYSSYVAEDVRLYRENEFPVIGKKAAIKRIGAEKGKINFAHKSSFFGAADLSYSLSTYTRTHSSGKVIEKGNYMQIWKLKNGKWKIVLDIFKPVP
jgi:ketosteroid isomerase-like protein